MTCSKAEVVCSQACSLHTAKCLFNQSPLAKEITLLQPDGVYVVHFAMG